MRRFRRLAPALFSGSSLLLCLAACSLWFRSYSGSDYLTRYQTLSADANEVRGRSHTIRWTRGRIHLVRSDMSFYAPVNLPPTGLLASGGPLPPLTWGTGRLGRGHHEGWDDPTPQSFWNRLGFYAPYVAGAFSTSWSDETERQAIVPAWLLPAVLALPPFLWLLPRLRARRRRAKGLCLSCGYDIRATPDRCPECGHIYQKVSAQAPAP